MQNSLSKVNNFAQIAASNHKPTRLKDGIHSLTKYVFKSDNEVLREPFEKDTRRQFNAMMPTINKNKQVSDCSGNKELS